MYANAHERENHIISNKVKQATPVALVKRIMQCTVYGVSMIKQVSRDKRSMLSSILPGMVVMVK